MFKIKSNIISEYLHSKECTTIFCLRLKAIFKAYFINFLFTKRLNSSIFVFTKIIAYLRAQFNYRLSVIIAYIWWGGGGEKLIKSLSKKKSTIKRKNNNKYFPLKFSVNFHYQISLNDENTEAKKKKQKSSPSQNQNIGQTTLVIPASFTWSSWHSVIKMFVEKN